jgi:hypothetical protein
MKRTFLSFAFLGMALLCHAQRQFKNEFSVGYFAAGEFFDASAFKFSKFNGGRSISLSYKRHFKKKYTIGLTYSRCSFQYVPLGTLPTPLKVFNRYQQTFTANLGIGYTIWKMNLRAKTGIRYNRRGEQSKMIRYGIHSGGWGEAYGEIYEYSKIGPMVGASIAHPIIWRFFGELDCEYVHLFSGVDRNQMLLSYRIGFRF